MPYNVDAGGDVAQSAIAQEREELKDASCNIMPETV